MRPGCLMICCPPIFYIKEMQPHGFHGVRSAYDPVVNQGIGNLQHFSMNLEIISDAALGKGSRRQAKA